MGTLLKVFCLLLLCECGKLAVVGRQKRQTTSGYNPSDYGWLEVAYSPTELDNLPPGLLEFDGAERNYEFNQQLLDALSTLDASFRRALESGDFSGLENNNLQAVENSIIYALAGEFAMNIDAQELVQILNNEKIQLQGAAHLLRFAPIAANTRIANDLAYTTYPFTEPAVMCAVLLSFLGEDTSQANYVPYKLLSQVPYDSIDIIDEFVPGATYMMLRSYEITTDRDHFVQILYQFSKQTIDWTKELSRCKAIMWGAFQNLGSALDTWADLEEFDDLLQKTARMFVCVPPKKLRELQSASLMQTLPFFNNEDFDWMHGYSLVYQLLRGNDAPSKIFGNTITDMKKLNKFLTMDLLRERDSVQPGFLDDVVLIPSSLAVITEYTDDPLLLEFLFARALGADKFNLPATGGDVSDLDVQRVAPFVGVLSVHDIFQYRDRQVEESISYFQKKAMKVGSAFMLVSKYLRYRTKNNALVYLTQTDFEQINLLLPALDYRYFNNCTTVALIGAMPTFRNVADRLNTRGIHLTSAQAHVIAARAQMDSGRNAKLMTQLGPSLSMALSPAFFLEQLTDLDEFFTVRVEDGEITEGQEFFKIHWTPFQKSVLFSMYRQQIRTLSLNGMMLSGLGPMATGISAHDILTSDYSEIIGITSAVMRNGGDMNKAWLLSLQIRKAFTSIYGLRKFSDFHLGLLGTANLQALDGMTLRMFSIREMELLNLGDCNQVISKIGDYKDVYLIPPPKRRELVCFYITRCRLIVSSDVTRFVPAYEKNNHMNQFFNNWREDGEYMGHKYDRMHSSYCNLVNQRMMDDQSLTREDFNTLGHLVCDLPAVALRSINVDTLEDNLWMFHNCLFDSTTGDAIYRLIRSRISEPRTIESLGHSLCSVVPSYEFLSTGSGSNINFADLQVPLIQYVHYAYEDYYKMEDKYGLTKQHLNYGLFAFREISRSQQSRIQTCFRNIAEQAWTWFIDISKDLDMNHDTGSDVRLTYQSSNVNNFRYNDNNDNNDVYYSSSSNNNNVNNVNEDFYDESANNVNDIGNVYDTGRAKRQLTRNLRDEPITCQAVHVLNGGSMIFILNQLERMQAASFARCIDYWGYNFNTTREQRRVLKDRVEELSQGFDNILPEYLVQMKWLAREMTKDELYYLNLKSKQAMYHISYWPWHRWQRIVLFRNIQRTHGYNPSTMSILDFKSLGEFFCGMESSDIASISPQQYYAMATFVGQLVTCDYNQMRSLLAKARSTQAFGDIEHWEERHILAIGSAISGMSSTHLESLTPQRNRNRRNLVAAIPAHVIPMIPDSVIENLDVSFFEALTPEQVIAFTPRQWHDMNREQANAAMDIWFGYDQWPYSYLKGFREAGSEVVRVSILSMLAVFICQLLL